MLSIWNLLLLLKLTLDRRPSHCCDVNSLLQTLHWLPVEQRINYKLAVLTFKTQQTSSPQYLNQHISLRTSARNTRSSSVPLLCAPFRRTSFAIRSFSTAAPLTWNSLLPAVLNCDSLSLYFQIQTLNSSVFYCFLLTILPTCSANASVAA